MVTSSALNLKKTAKKIWPSRNVCYNFRKTNKQTNKQAGSTLSQKPHRSSSCPFLAVLPSSWIQRWLNMAYISQKSGHESLEPTRILVSAICSHGRCQSGRPTNLNKHPYTKSIQGCVLSKHIGIWQSLVQRVSKADKNGHLRMSARGFFFKFRRENEEPGRGGYRQGGGVGCVN